MNVQYKKPRMNFVSLRNENKVAATCWGYHGTSTVLFVDVDGPGFASFQIGDGGCDLNLVNVRYYASRAEYDAGVYANVVPGDPMFNIIKNEISSHDGGKKASNYYGEGTFVFPDNPSDMS